MSRRARLASYGTAFLVAALGIALWIAIGGVTGGALTLALTGGGLGAALLLVFYEIGLSEDRAREDEDRSKRTGRDHAGRTR